MASCSGHKLWGRHVRSHVALAVIVYAGFILAANVELYGVSVGGVGS